MFGHPQEAKAPLSTVTLDLPVEIGWVSTDPAKPALYLLEIDETLPQSEWEELLPVETTWSGHVVTFQFDPIWAGNYRVVVHTTRMRVDGTTDAPELYDAQGFPWSGWNLTVLGEARTLPELPEEIDPDLDLPEEPVPHAPLRELRVLLDGKLVPSGASELSGEVLTVESTEPVEIELRIEHLLPSAPDTLYERYLIETSDVTAAKVYRTHYTSTGPIGDWKWAAYHGRSTEGRLPTENGRLLVKTPVIRPPLAIDPLVKFTEKTVTPDDHPNTYKVIRYEVTPHYEATKLSKYLSLPIVFPLTIVDEDNTPDTNPRLFPEAIYLGDSVPLTASDKAAVFDLPLFARIHLYADGELFWWGQTRLLGLPITLSRFEFLLETGSRVTSPAEAADIRLRIWRASLEALQLWRCSLPAEVPSTIEEFVLTRLALGWPRENDTQGRMMVRLGDHLYAGQSDHMLQRRLSALAQMLEACQTTAPLFPEDSIEAETAYLASEANPALYPAPSPDLTQLLAPLYGPGCSSRDYYDPPQVSRPQRAGGNPLRR